MKLFANSRERRQQIKNPYGSRVIRPQIIRGDGSKTGVGVPVTCGESPKAGAAGRGGREEDDEEERLEGRGERGGREAGVGRGGVLLASLPCGGENVRKKCSNVRRRAGGRLLPLHEYE